MPKAESAETPVPQTRKAKAKSVSRSPVALDGPKSPAWVPVTGGVLALGAVILVGAQIGAAGAVQSLNSQEAAVGFVTNPLSPCPLRMQTTQQLIQQVPADVSVPTTYDALAIDPRCAPMVNFASELAIQSGELERADSLTLEGIEFDPLLDLSWILRARYLLATGDATGAQVALDEALRVQALYPETSEKVSVDEVQAEIDAAKG